MRSWSLLESEEPKRQEGTRLFSTNLSCAQDRSLPSVTMGCSGAGLVSIIILFVAVVLNVISFVLPLWSTSDVVNSGLSDKVQTADFAAGVWGYCTDVELIDSESTKNATLSFDHCYFFHTSSDYDVSDVDAELAKNFSSFSICDGYNTAKDMGELARQAYSSALALKAGMDYSQFDVFLHKSCSGLGSATLVFASLAASTGVLAFIGVVLGVTCCKNKSSFNALFKVLISFAFVSNFLTFILWLVQSHALNKKDDVSLSGAFVLNVLSAVLFLIAGGLLGRHNAMK